MRAMEFLFKSLDASGHLLEKIMLLLDDILQRIDLLIQLTFNIIPFIVFAHSVKSVVFLRGVMGSAGRTKQALRALWARTARRRPRLIGLLHPRELHLSTNIIPDPHMTDASTRIRIPPTPSSLSASPMSPTCLL